MRKRIWDCYYLEILSCWLLTLFWKYNGNRNDSVWQVSTICELEYIPEAACCFYTVDQAILYNDMSHPCLA